jgi:uncharacterized membrane protein
MLNLIVPLFVSSFMFGLVPILDKKALEYFPNVKKYSVYRLIAYAVFTFWVIIGYAFYMGLKIGDLKISNMNKSGLKFLIPLALINSVAFVFYILSIKAGEHTGMVSLVGMGVTLITTLLLSHYYLGQRLKPGMGLSFFVIFIGIVMTLYYSSK